MECCSRPVPADGAPLSLPALLALIDRELEPVLAYEAGDDRRLVSGTTGTAWLVFVLGGREMALPLDDVEATGRLATLAPLPNVPAWVLGIVHNRGEILPVIDLAGLLDLPAALGTGPRQPYLLVRRPDLACCLAVERVLGIVRLDGERSAAGAATVSTGGAEADRLSALECKVLRVGPRRLRLLDGERLAQACRLDQRRGAAAITAGEGSGGGGC